MTEQDVYLFNEGTHSRLFEKFGAHPRTVNGVAGTYFAVWAPDATEVSVVGSFNGWNRDSHPLEAHHHSGIWEGFLPEVKKGDLYKFFIKSRFHHYAVEKADPFGLLHETPPKTASVVWELDYQWKDQEWMRARGAHNALDAPSSVYEVHLGSWRRVPEDEDRWLSYREIAEPLAEYVKWMGFTHVEFLPLMEHPFYGSWGYQTTGYFAPTSRYGTPEDLMYLIDVLHREGIGVILDWVPSHFPGDEHGLAYFDGTYLFEHSDPRKGFHPDWQSYIFNYGRNEVRAFLLSSAMYWLDRFHIDGIRVDAVASMLYLDYSRNAGEWIPNKYGGRENLEAIEFLRQLNRDAYGAFPDIQTTAEESTAWPMVSRPIYVGGLGFGLKWDMGWMHDTLHYLARDPIHRKFHHGELTFRMIYAFNENFVLPISHDEVVHGKGSLIGKMPNDPWQKFANLRLLYSYMWSQPGKKLLFMGCEFAQWAEWNHDSSLQWHLTDDEMHSGIQHLIRNLNRLYRDMPALHQRDTDASGFQWIDGSDAEQSVLSYLRQGAEGSSPVAVVMNFTPLIRSNYRVGVPSDGRWAEIFNSDASEFGGSGQGNFGGVEAAPIPMHGRPYSITVNVPPLGAVFFTPER
ncbi:MAG TPA: 1,4-alpha-glucan branching protein GlgB [Thermoanaerobaculia bacterium]|nr:1,4-alpha-glucan branching protein GlgB [Thermoanaerobaculia bacterium]